MGTRAALAASALAAPPLLRSLFATCRAVHVGSRLGRENLVKRRPQVCALWHQRILMILIGHCRSRAAVMVSRSFDGEIIARAMLRMGYVLARGSSSRGGREALQEMVRLIGEGHVAGFVADGPRGPARVMKIGAIVAARDTGAPVCGITASASRSIFARSWDRTEIFKPFSTIVFGYTEPFSVPRDASNEECERLRLRLERELNEIDARCVEQARRRD
jgi:lysophospholipid acyltransferase (LPLAT)-like uncharacterized protein